MTLDTAEKQKLIDSHQIHPTDTGSVVLQVAMLSERISKLSDHLQKNNQDYASRQGLLKMIGKRKRMLSYIKNKDVNKDESRAIAICKNSVILKKNLIDQVTGTVRWRESMEFAINKGVKKITELGSGKVLTGIAKRMVKNISNESFENPEDFNNFYK